MERVPYRGHRRRRAPMTDCACRSAILLDNVRSMYNVGAFFRTADGAGIERLYLAASPRVRPKSAISKTALGAEERVRWSRRRRCRRQLSRDLHRRLRNRRHRDQRSRRRYLRLAAATFRFACSSATKWTAFPVRYSICDTHVRIPMLGLKHSLNVASAGAIVMYELLRKYRALCR